MSTTSPSVACGNCGAANTADAFICTNCGVVLAAYAPFESATPTTTTTTPPIRSYASRTTPPSAPSASEITTRSWYDEPMPSYLGDAAEAETFIAPPVTTTPAPIEPPATTKTTPVPAAITATMPPVTSSTPRPPKTPRPQPPKRAVATPVAPPVAQKRSPSVRRAPQTPIVIGILLIFLSCLLIGIFSAADLDSVYIGFAFLCLAPAGLILMVVGGVLSVLRREGRQLRR